MGEIKTIVSFVWAEDQPPLLGDEVQECGTKAVCLACPLRAEGLVVDDYLEVPIGTKAVPGSEQAGLKLVDVGDGNERPACFHPNRSSLGDQV